MPKVSVIIPVYGVEKYIERCARSLFEQTIDDIEYLFIDDCTPDKSVEILKHVLEEYPQRKDQVVIHRMEQNSGQAKVREWGMRNATGEYIIHCDSDDWVDVRMYEEMYNRAKVEQADVVVCDYVLHNGVTEQERVQGSGKVDCMEFLLRVFLQKDTWALWNKLFSRKISDFDKIVYPKGNMGEDMCMTLQMLSRCRKISYVPKDFYKYFVNSESITRKLSKESCLNNYSQLKGNADIIFNLFDNVNVPDAISEGLLYLKCHVNNMLIPLVGNKYYYNEWRRLYSGLWKKLMFSKHIDFMFKLRILLTLCRLLPRKKFRISVM